MTHILWTIVFILLLLIGGVSIPVQRRAMNKIAFGRSMFISWTAIIFGFIVGLLPGIPATVVAACLFILGIGMMLLMTLKSYQHLERLKRSGRS